MDNAAYGVFPIVLTLPLLLSGTALVLVLTRRRKDSTPMTLLDSQIASLVRQYGRQRVQAALDQVVTTALAPAAAGHEHGPACYDYPARGCSDPVLICPIPTDDDTTPEGR